MRFASASFFITQEMKFIRMKNGTYEKASEAAEKMAEAELEPGM